ncbi:MAG TPA: hypothetical protein VHU87_11020 [Rhizomicrobium sp.]|jgi:hypothetical protein|nr:hypothetical protein [Rhizomicrobium sp.]
MAAARTPGGYRSEFFPPEMLAALTREVIVSQNEFAEAVSRMIHKREEIEARRGR